MSIASELTALNGYILGAYDEIDTKGGTVPANKNMANLASAIGSISTGSSTTITPLSVTENGTYTAPAGTAYSPVTVNVSGGGDDQPEPKLTAYDNATGVLTGEGFGTSSGTVYVFDRMQNKDIAVATSSWSDTSITLSTPIDVANMVGTTSTWVETSDEKASNKIMVFGDIAVPGYGILYYTDNDGTVHSINMTESVELARLATGNMETYALIGGMNIWMGQIVGIQLAAKTTAVGSNFLKGCYNLVQPIDISHLTVMNGNFLDTCVNFNQPLDLSNLTSIGSSFLTACCSFNQPLDLSNITSINTDFLYGCKAFNQPLDISHKPSIGAYFLANCSKFNQPLDFSGFTSIPGYLLQQCYSFNHPLDISHVTSIGSGFLAGCYSFNHPLDISHVTSIGSDFLNQCYAFNQPLDISNVTTISSNFLKQCYGFDQPLDTSHLTTIGSSFLYGCSSFNQPLDLSGLTTIPNYFLYQCYSFDQPLDLSNITSINAYFMNGCRAFKHKIILGSGTVGNSFLYQSTNINEVDVGTTTPSSNNQTLAPYNVRARAYVDGVVLTGANAPTWVSTLPNITNTPYRKLIDGTA